MNPLPGQCNVNCASVRLKADVKIRPARGTDAASVAEVLIRSRAEYLPYAPSAHPPDDVRRWVREHLLPTGEVTVAEHCGEIVGVMATSRDDRYSWIDQLYLRPGWLRRGIGGALLEVAHARLRRPIRLYTFQQNSIGRSFYERHGYRPVAFTDGAANEERCPDVLYELDGSPGIS
jgi:GNAT superfamily N-acetyltransferase